MSEADKQPFYRALTMGIGLALLAWLRTHNHFNAALVGVLTAVAVMGVEWGWWVRAGEHLPAAWEQLRGLVLVLLSWLPAARVELRPYDVVFGWQANNPRQPVVGNLKRMRSFAIFGVNGAGKTSLLHSVLHDITTSTSEDKIGLVIFDPKGGLDYSIYRRLPHLLWPIASTPADVARSLQCLQGLMDGRADLYRRIPNGRICNDLDRFNEINEELQLGLPELTPVLVVVDEVQDLIKHHKGAQALLERVAKLGRAYGVFLCPSTQLPKAEALPTEIKAECYPRFVGMMASARLYGVIAEVPEDIYKAHALREHQFYVRLGPDGWQVMTANLVPYEELERVALALSDGYDEPGWPEMETASTPQRSLSTPQRSPQGTASTPQRSDLTPQRSLSTPQWSEIRWKSDAVKKAQLTLYFKRFAERPTAASTLEDIGWSQRSAEKWLPIIWEIIEAER